jgi:hypothetical protein
MDNEKESLIEKDLGTEILIRLRNINLRFRKFKDELNKISIGCCD